MEEEELSLLKKSLALLLFISTGLAVLAEPQFEQLPDLPEITKNSSPPQVEKKATEAKTPNTIDIEKIIRYSSKSSLEFTRRGIHYEENKNFEDAIKDYTRALELTPNRSELFIRRAVCYEEIKQYNDAIKDLTEVLAMRPYRAEIFSMRGKIYTKTEQFIEALLDFDKAIDLEPLRPDFYADRGDFYTVIGKTDLAKRDYLAAAELFAYSAKNLKEAKMWRDAIKEYDKAIIRDPDNGEFKRLRNECVEELAKEIKAAEEEAAKLEAKKNKKKNDKLPKEELSR